MPEKIRVLVFPVDGDPREEWMENTLEAQQALVGGYVRPIGVATGLVLTCVEVDCDEQLPPVNARIVMQNGATLEIFGQFFVARLAGSALASITDADLKTIVYAFGRTHVRTLGDDQGVN